ncbi:MAG: DUF1127 domain-containing protein [Pseudolabrys sp.]|jgi:uncharacterized protein YjiS (DUF1127 family)
MSTNVPIVPVAAGALVRAFLSLLAFVTRWLKHVARARRHRRAATALAGLDRHMLADIGLTRADLQDAFSTSFWEDPTLLLSERVNERRRSRKATPALPPADEEEAFRRPPANRLPRYLI